MLSARDGSDFTAIVTGSSVAGFIEGGSSGYISEAPGSSRFFVMRVNGGVHDRVRSSHAMATLTPCPRIRPTVARLVNAYGGLWFLREGAQNPR
jgi:hypothetical protein